MSADQRRATGSVDKPIDIHELCLSYPFDLQHFRAHGFCPRKDLTPVELAPPVDWAGDPFRDRNWCFQLHAWRMNAPFLKAYQASQDAALLREALNYALDWWRFHQRKKATDFSWKDMAVGLRAMQLAYFLQEEARGRLDLDAAEKAALRAMAEAHAAKLSREGFLRLNNHGLFQAYGLKLLATVLGADQERADGFIQKVLLSQFCDNGVHKENSPEYHAMMLSLLKRFSQFGRLPAEAEELSRQAGRALRAMVNGAGELARVGDTGQRAHAFAFKDDDLKVHDLSKAGYVMARKGRSSLFLTGMAQSYTHKHADELSFELVHKGAYVFIDPGKYAYEVDPWRRYVTSSQAHNTISLYDTEVPLEAVALTGSLLHKPIRQSEKLLLGGRVARQGYFSQDRTIIYYPEAGLTIADRVLAPTQRKFVSTLLLGPGLEPELHRTHILQVSR